MGRGEGLCSCVCGEGVRGVNVWRWVRGCGRFSTIARVFFWRLVEFCVDGCEGVGGCGCVIWVEHDIAAGAHELEEIFHPGGLGFADFLDVFGGLGGHC